MKISKRGDDRRKEDILDMVAERHLKDPCRGLEWYKSGLLGMPPFYCSTHKKEFSNSAGYPDVCPVRKSWLRWLEKRRK